MPLASGARIGPYEILALIGKGGMGEVYRARDTKLKREVAIKVLPEAFSSDADRMARFQREAEMLASLNHPNIATIYGVEDRALVMELVEGQSPKGPLSFDEAWKIASQIADALEYAHEKGIVHRDLKPANVIVTHEGVVKLLDFGLAKAFTGQREGSVPKGEDSPTLTIGATEAGVILGTAAYMSPEQARGKQVDRRADVWAFGVILYELLTGERLFKGEDAAETLAAVIHKQPGFEKVPTQARRLLQECLQKDPKLRLRDIGYGKRLLDSGGSPEPAVDSRAAKRKPVAWIAVAAGLAVALTGVSWIAYRATRPAPLKPLVRLDLDVGNEMPNASNPGANAVLSPDGNRLVYVARGRLFERRLDQFEDTELMGTEGASNPFFSPDGQWVAFFAQGFSALKKVSVEGGAPVALCNAAGVAGASWGEDGSIIAALSFSGPLSYISSAGGGPSPVTKLAAGEITHRWPQVLPGGKAVLFTASSNTAGFDLASIEVMSLSDRHPKVLVRGGTFGRYVGVSGGAGYLLYVNNGTLFAATFDPNTLDMRGTPVPVLDRVAYSPLWGSAQLDVSGPLGSETLVYRAGEAGGKFSIVQWLDASGKGQPLLAKPGLYFTPRLSPDDRRLAMTVREGASSDIWIYEPQRDTMTRLTFGGLNQNPQWSPDGRYIVFEGAGGMFWTRSDGAGKPQPLTQSNGRQIPYSFLPDGSRLAFFGATTETSGLWTLPLKSGADGLSAGPPEAYLRSGSSVGRHPAFSPDGHWMAYSSNESGAFQIFVRAFPDKGGKWQISNDGGLYPEWSRNGRELYFRNNDNYLMVANYTAKGDSFVADKPRMALATQLADPGFNGITYDVAANGRIAGLIPAVTSEKPSAPNRLIFLENFVDELRRKVPMK